MIGLNKNLEGLHVFGTDGKKPLISAFLHEFKFAVRLTCFNYVQRNIKEELQKLVNPDELKSEILNDLFGRQVGSTLPTGLVHSESDAVFQQKLNLLLNKWKQNKANDVEEFVNGKQGRSDPRYHTSTGT